MKNRRFIAGATCPKCSEVDSLVTYQKDGEEFRECVECDFLDKMVFHPVKRELETRVNISEAEKKTETETIKFIDAGSKHSE